MKKLLCACGCVFFLSLVFGLLPVPDCPPAASAAETSSPLIGITNGSVYTRAVKPRWYDRPGASSTAKYRKNSGAWLDFDNGTRLENGDYQVKLRTVTTPGNTSAEKLVSFTVDTEASQARLITNSQADGFDAEIEFVKGTFENPAVYTLWVEDDAGGFIHDLFVSSMAATNRMAFSDLLTLRPQSLPYWSHKAGRGKQYGSDFLYLAVPPDYPPDLDGVTGATPPSGFLLKTTVRNAARKLKLLFEINQAWDTGWYFTAYPVFTKDPYYEDSEEPSLIYSVAIDLDDPQEEYTFELAGFGHYAGRTGTLYTNFFAVDPQDKVSKNKFEKAPLMVGSLMARIDPASIPASSSTTTIKNQTTTGSTTTTTIVRKLCPAEKIFGAHQGDMLGFLRRFRDERLLRSSAGRCLVGLYYAHSAEVARILSCKPELAALSKELLEDCSQALAATLRSGTALQLSKDQQDRITALLHQLRKKSSPRLEADLADFEEQLRSGKLFSDLSGK